MKRILTPFLLLLAFTTFAQQVQNVVATQQGSSVVVNYDLTGSPNSPYFVKLLMSKNGGQSFSQPLKYVTGDVGNANAGNNKRIIWDAKQELTAFNGNAIFRVESTSLSTPMPDPVEDEPGRLQILKAKQSGSKVTITFFFTAANDGRVYMRGGSDQTFIIDNIGNKTSPTSGNFADSGLNYSVTVIEGVPIRGKMIFDKIVVGSTMVPMLAITVKYNYSNYLYKFKNVPITK